MINFLPFIFPPSKLFFHTIGFIVNRLQIEAGGGPDPQPDKAMKSQKQPFGRGKRRGTI